MEGLKKGPSACTPSTAAAAAAEGGGEDRYEEKTGSTLA
jgi:hypothetical protein